MSDLFCLSCSQVKITYSQSTLDKDKLQCSATEVRQRYDTGILLAPCVLMQCVEFNLDFWNALVEKKNLVEKIEVGHPVIRIGPQKRKRAISMDDDDFDDSSANDSTSAMKSMRRRSAL